MSKECSVCGIDFEPLLEKAKIGDSFMYFCPNHLALFEEYLITFDEHGNVLCKESDMITGETNKIDITKYDSVYLERHRDIYFGKTTVIYEKGRLNRFFCKAMEYLQSIDITRLRNSKEREFVASMLIGMCVDVYQSDYINRDSCKGDDGFVSVPVLITTEETNDKYIGLATIWVTNSGTLCDLVLIHPEKGILDDINGEVNILSIIGKYNYRPLLWIQGDYHANYDNEIVY